jgi:hypothetical protein
MLSPVILISAVMLALVMITSESEGSDLPLGQRMVLLFILRQL